jgi:hypothetical protein
MSQTTLSLLRYGFAPDDVGGMEWDDKGEYARRDEALDLLWQAATEFDKRALSPQYAAAERARIMACSQWLRDMAQELSE